ncbi:hypothetical protein ALC57_05172 [Trachymyrmex cornetzi]|uniref:Uncharacterized protein n=1 Tax=Trachymyrmex cornetzi TaxID=471704 RepID=A0A151JBM6_9HYME|nr:hypothetical protein ALC57_05172 [Trachymyrmex cornetzi]
MQESTVSTVQSAQTKQSPVGRRYHQCQFADRQDEKKGKTDLQLILVAPQEEQNKVEKSPTEDVKKLDETKAATQTQVMVLPTESSDVTQIYALVKIDKQGQIQLLNNNGPIGRNYTESGQHENLT